MTRSSVLTSNNCHSAPARSPWPKFVRLTAVTVHVAGLVLGHLLAPAFAGGVDGVGAEVDAHTSEAGRPKSVELTQRLLPEPVGSRLAGNQFGSSIAIDGTLAVVGAPQVDLSATDAGAAYILRFVDEQWDYVATLQPEGLMEGDRFGADVDLEGKRAVVSATGRREPGKTRGAVYVFEFDGESWLETAQLTAMDEGDVTFFGVDLSLNGDRLAVGSFGVESPGAAFVFEHEGAKWSSPTKLVADDSLPGDRFGQAVSLSGTDLLVGAWGYARNDISTGAAYFFQLANGEWQQQQRIVPAAAGGFGLSVAVQGYEALIAAPLDAEQGIGAGAVYAYRRSEAGWVQRNKLLPPFAGFLTRFGSQVSLDGHRALIGSAAGLVATGTIFALRGEEWIEEATLTGDPVDSSLIPVALAGPVALVADPRNDGNRDVSLPEAGAVFSFREDSGGWSGPVEIDQPRIPGADLAFFGWAVVLDGDRAFTAAPGEDSNGQSAGAVYVHQYANNAWKTVQKLHGESRGDRFGTSIAVYGNRLLVGSPWESTVDPEAGAVYAFEWQDTEWLQTAKLTPEVAGARQHFGTRLALHENRAIISSSEFVGEFERFGHVHVYEHDGVNWSATGELESSNLQINDGFGSAVVLGNGFALVAASGRAAAPDATYPDSSGAVEVFNFDAPDWVSVDEWSPGERTSPGLFGRAVAADEEWAAVVEPLAPEAPGIVHVYRRQAGAWAEYQTLRAPAGDESLRNGQFGLGVTIDGPRLLIGALSINDGSLRGLLYGYEFRGVSWAFADRFEAPDPTRGNEEFATGPSSMSIEGNRAFVGAYGDPTVGHQAGAAYVLEFGDPLGDEIFEGNFE